jgi:UDP-N-acetylmuramate dehydrogenase
MVVRVAAEAGVPVMMLGRGSNMLVADAGFAGVVIRLGSFADQIDIAEANADGDITVTAGAAVALPVLARKTAAAGCTGFEWAVGVPGSIGGAVRMNAGGHGSDMASSLVSALVADTVSGVTSDRTLGALGLGFRASHLTDSDVVLSARLRLRGDDPHATQARIDDVVRWRREHQPGGQNCGSVFVNPVPGEVSAGALIDSLGLRGFRIGTAEVSMRHANFIQADQGGRADDVAALISEVRQRVFDATGYVLRSEVRMVGFEALEC